MNGCNTRLAYIFSIITLPFLLMFLITKEQIISIESYIVSCIEVLL